MLLDIALIVVAFAIASLAANWRWWLLYAIVPVVGFGLVAFALSTGRHDSWLMLLALAAPFFTGAAGGLITQAILLWRPQAGIGRWAILAIGLAVTLAAAIWLL